MDGCDGTIGGIGLGEVAHKEAKAVRAEVAEPGISKPH